MDAGAWSWLEVAKITSSVLTPIAIATLGVYVHRVTKAFEHRQWRSQKLIEKRLDVYDDLAPDLNDLLCYFTFVGCWRDLDPPAVVAMKRKVDKKIHLASPLFSKQFFSSCMDFQNLCFETYSGWGRDALLRTTVARRKEARPRDWNGEWDKCFSEQPSDPRAVRAAYSAIMAVLSEDIGVHPGASVPPSGRVPSNVQ